MKYTIGAIALLLAFGVAAYLEEPKPSSRPAQRRESWVPTPASIRPIAAPPVGDTDRIQTPYRPTTRDLVPRGALAVPVVPDLGAVVNVTPEEQRKIEEALDTMLDHDTTSDQWLEDLETILGPERAAKYIEAGIKKGQRMAEAMK